jgi:drug/metabolite transporter (DMT)-like permease
MRPTRTATQRLILACAMWGLSFPAVKALTLAQQAAAPSSGSMLHSCAGLVIRFGLAGFIVVAGLWFVRGKPRPSSLEWQQGLLIALSSGLGMLLQVDGLGYTQASTSAFLTQATVVLIPLVRVATTRRPIAAAEAACIALAVAGVAILSDFRISGWHIGRGEWETLLSACCFTAHIMLVSAPRYATNDDIHVSAIMFVGISLLFAPIVALLPGGWALGLQGHSTAAPWLFIAILVGPCTLMAFLWMNRWQRHVSPTTAALIYCLEPVFASLLALFLPGWFSQFSGLPYPNETLTPQLLWGGGLILLANLGSSLRPSSL